MSTSNQQARTVQSNRTVGTNVRTPGPGLSGNQNPPEGQRPTNSTPNTVSSVETFLKNSSVICDIVQRPTCFIILVPLNKQLMFDRLVELYNNMFTIMTRAFGRIRDAANAQATPQQLARAQASAIMHDLYCVNRTVVLTHCREAFAEHYSIELAMYNVYYDKFATMVLTEIRATRVVSILQDTLYVPIFRDINVKNSENPLNLEGYLNDPVLSRAIRHTFQDRKILSLYEVHNTNQLGTKCWLPDWYPKEPEQSRTYKNAGRNIQFTVYNRANVHFIQTGNFGHQEFVLSVIFGIPITDTLAPYDIPIVNASSQNATSLRITRAHVEEMVTATIEAELKIEDIKGMDTDSKAIPQSLIQLSPLPTRKRRRTRQTQEEKLTEDQQKLLSESAITTPMYHLYYSRVIDNWTNEVALTSLFNLIGL